MNKHPLTAIVMGLIPGLGHKYLGRNIRALLYSFSFFALVLLFLITFPHYPSEGIFFFGVIVWFVNLVDLVVYLIESRSRNTAAAISGDNQTTMETRKNEAQSERFYTMLISMIPGLGHFQMGLMQRGLSFLIAFFGTITMIFFVNFVTHFDGILVFLFVLPIIWLYSLFDVIQLLNRKQRGEVLIDQTIFEQLEEGRELGKKSKTFAVILSVFPGAGHMYLGLQQRGLQLMAGFLLSFYILDALRLSLFLFLLPILWFYSLFDALQHVSKYGVEEIKDEPIMSWLKKHQKWLGIGLLLLGFYHLLDQFVLGLFGKFFPELQISFWFHKYFQVFIVSTLLIAGGFRLLAGSKNEPASNRKEPEEWN